MIQVTPRSAHDYYTFKEARQLAALNALVDACGENPEARTVLVTDFLVQQRLLNPAHEQFLQDCHRIVSHVETSRTGALIFDRAGIPFNDPAMRRFRVQALDMGLELESYPYFACEQRAIQDELDARRAGETARRPDLLQRFLAKLGF